MALDFLVVDDEYQGPLHVLLALAERQEVDLGRLSLSRLIDAFKEEMRRHPPPLEDLGQFLYVAARLIRLKATDVPTVEEDEPRTLGKDLALLAAVQKAAHWLSDHEVRDRVARRGPPPSMPRPERLERLDQALQRISARRRRQGQRTPTFSRPPAGPSLDELLTRWMGLLGREPKTVFNPAELPPTERAMTFLAALELCRRGDVSMHQPAPFAPVTFTLRRAGHGEMG